MDVFDSIFDKIRSLQILSETYIPGWVFVVFAAIPLLYIYYKFYSKKILSSVEETTDMKKEKLILSKQRVIALGADYKITKPQWLLYFVTITDKAFYFLAHTQIDQKTYSGDVETNVQEYKMRVWERILFADMSINFGRMFLNRYVKIEDKKTGFFVRIGLHPFFNKQGKGVEQYINENLSAFIEK